MTGPILESVQSLITGLIGKGKFVGMAMEVWRGETLLHRSAAGMADEARDLAMSPDTIGRGFSITKAVTAAAMMIVREQGLWSPDDPITRFLPEFENTPLLEGFGADGSPVLGRPRNVPTVGQLLTHTAGFSYGFDPDWLDGQYRAADLWRSDGSDDLMARIARMPLAYEPGTRWRYSVACDLQGVIIERISGLALPEFMQRQIFDPLGMKDTGFVVPVESADRLAELYAWKGEGLVPTTTPELSGTPFDLPSCASGGGGLFTTASDFSRFTRMLANGGRLGDAQILSETAVRWMMSNHLNDDLLAGDYGIGIHRLRPGYGYGVNGVVVTDPQLAGVAIGQGGYLWEGLAGAWFWVDPERRISFVGMVQRMTDNTTPNMQRLSQNAVSEALQTL